MASGSQQRRTWSSGVLLGAADAVKEILPAPPGTTPGDRTRIVVSYCMVLSLISAAQAVDIESNDAAVEILKLAASFAVGATVVYDGEKGIGLPANQALVIKPAAVGPSVWVIAEGYYEKVAP